MKEMERRVKKQMKQIGFGLRDTSSMRSDKQIDRDFSDICRQLDKGHERFKEVLRTDSSIEPARIQKYYGLSFTEKFRRMAAYQEEIEKGDQFEEFTKLEAQIERDLEEYQRKQQHKMGKTLVNKELAGIKPKVFTNRSL